MYIVYYVYCTLVLLVIYIYDINWNVKYNLGEDYCITTIYFYRIIILINIPNYISISKRI